MLPEGPILVPGNTDEVGTPVVGLVGIPKVEFPVDGVPVDGVPVVRFPVDGVPVVGVLVEPELGKQLEAFEGGEVETTAAPLKSHVAPVEAFF